MAKPYFERIPTNKLFIDEAAYQRKRRPKKVEAMVKKGWDERACLTLGVGERSDGTFAVWDGGHRLEAAVELGIRTLPCMVTPKSDSETEAGLFVNVNRDRSAPYSAELLKGLIEHKDPGAIEIAQIVESHGFQLADWSGPNNITATSALMKAYDRYGSANLDAALGVLKEAWHGDALSLAGKFIVGVSRFLDRVKPDKYMRESLVRKLAATTPLEVNQKAAGTQKMFGSGSDEAFAMAIALVYNQGRGSQRKVDLSLFNRSTAVAAGAKKRLAAAADAAPIAAKGR